MSLVNFTKWGKHHQILAEKYLSEHNQNTKLPKLPENMMDWIKAARPKVDGKTRSFLAAPFWIPIYMDSHDFQMIIAGRQVYKSTACTDMIAAEATSHSGIQICYITHDERNLSAFSKQKLKVGTFLVNPTLAKFLRHPGNVGEVSLKNNSTIYLVTDNYQYRHLEGKSPSLCVLDEAQYQDLEYFGKVRQTMMATKGKMKIFGIGGEAGSPYEKLWQQTNQMKWEYDDPNWRDDLQFDENGLVIEDYLKKVLKGRWVAQNPSSIHFHGYQIPQTICATIPLTEEDAITKYKIHPSYSIEFQKKDLPKSMFLSHVMGMFYNSPHRPVTAEMIQRCVNPYRYLSLLSADDVFEIKQVYGNQIIIGMGVDFGSGKSSYTAIAIMIWWRKVGRVQLAHIERREPENQLKQAEYILDLFNKYHCDIGVGDLGYGVNQIKIIQDGGRRIDTGERYDGVGDNNFVGCRSVSDFTKPFQIFDDTIDEHGEQTGRVQIDKTWAVDQLIESMEKVVSHPVYPDTVSKKRAKLMIPSRNDYEVSILLNDMASITRKDLKILEDSILDPRQRPRKEYNHPPDSVMAVIYALISFKVKEESEWYWISA